VKVFVIHRFASRPAAIQILKTIAADSRITLKPVVLDSSGDQSWQSTAEAAMETCEAVVVYDMPQCLQSENATWEIDRANDIGRPVVVLDPAGPDQEEVLKLCAVYHDDEEFDSYFEAVGPHTEVLYKLMVESSEQLVERRQRMNAFFITAMGALLGIAGAITKFGFVESPAISLAVLGAFGVAGLLLCNSWRNLIDNYGKLNTAKFRVILKLEESLSAQIFAAEWAALGKGRRPKKYESFTSTENQVPLWFAVLIVGLLLLAALWYGLS
jgi:hypothetical protein